jgi:hypothetical protein
MANSPYREPEPLVTPQTARMMQAQYQIDRKIWARSLNDNDVRAMAADYMRGLKDECSIDAYEEYQRRFGEVTKQTAAQVRGRRAEKAAKERK